MLFVGFNVRLGRQLHVLVIALIKRLFDYLVSQASIDIGHSYFSVGGNLKLLQGYYFVLWTRHMHRFSHPVIDLAHHWCFPISTIIQLE